MLPVTAVISVQQAHIPPKGLLYVQIALQEACPRRGPRNAHNALLDVMVLVTPVLSAQQASTPQLVHLLARNAVTVNLQVQVQLLAIRVSPDNSSPLV